MRYIIFFILTAIASAQTRSPQIEIIPYSTGTQGILRFFEQRSNGTNHIQFRSPASLTTNFDIRWPTPTANSIWYTDSVLNSIGNDVNFVYDAANLRLGIGVPSPTRRLDIGSGDIRAGSYFFESPGTYTIGTNLNRAASIFTNSLIVSSTAGFGVSGHLVPATPDIWDLGFSTARWRDGWFARQLTTPWLEVPDGALLNPVRMLRNADTDFRLMAFPSNLCASCTWEFGPGAVGPDARLIWRRNGSNVMTLDSSGNVRVANGISPINSGIGSVGTFSTPFAEVFTQFLNLGTSPGQGFSSNANPDANYTRQLGSAIRRWDVLFGRLANLQSNIGSLAGFSIRDSGGTERAYLGDGGGTGGEMRLINGTGSEYFAAINGILRANGVNTLTTTVTLPCGTLTFILGLLTDKGTCP